MSGRLVTEAVWDDHIQKEEERKELCGMGYREVAKG